MCVITSDLSHERPWGRQAGASYQILYSWDDKLNKGTRGSPKCIRRTLTKKTNYNFPSSHKLNKDTRGSPKCIRRRLTKKNITTSFLRTNMHDMYIYICLNRQMKKYALSPANETTINTARSSSAAAETRSVKQEAQKVPPSIAGRGHKFFFIF